MPFENNRREEANNAANRRLESRDLARLARQEADRNKKAWMDSLPSLHEALEVPSYVEKRKKHDTPQIMEPISTGDQLMSGTLDSIRRQLNPSLAEALQTRWEKIEKSKQRKILIDNAEKKKIELYAYQEDMIETWSESVEEFGKVMRRAEGVISQHKGDQFATKFEDMFPRGESAHDEAMDTFQVINKALDTFQKLILSEAEASKLLRDNKTIGYMPNTFEKWWDSMNDCRKVAQKLKELTENLESAIENALKEQKDIVEIQIYTGSRDPYDCTEQKRKINIQEERSEVHLESRHNHYVFRIDDNGLTVTRTEKRSGVNRVYRVDMEAAPCIRFTEEVTDDSRGPDAVTMTSSRLRRSPRYKKKPRIGQQD